MFFFLQRSESKDVIRPFVFLDEYVIHPSLGVSSSGVIVLDLQRIKGWIPHLVLWMLQPKTNNTSDTSTFKKKKKFLLWCKPMNND
jgi:hypothetical protein